MPQQGVLHVAGLVAAATGGLVVGRPGAASAGRDQVRQRHTDELGLPDRLALARELRRRYPGAPYTLALLDLERFASFTNAFGRDWGAWILFHTAHRTAAAVEPAGFVARLRGHEFAAVLPLLPSTQAAEETGWVIRERVAEPLLVASHLIFPWSTVAITAGGPGDTLEDVLCRAAAAMDHAKRTSTGVVVAGQRLESRPPAEQDRARRTAPRRPAGILRRAGRRDIGLAEGRRNALPPATQVNQPGGVRGTTSRPHRRTTGRHATRALSDRA
jgi:GGDEF domain-containing protein